MADRQEITKVRYGLWGFTETLAPLLRLIAAREGALLEVAFACDGLEEQVRRICPEVAFERQWESLLHGDRVDAVLIGSGADRIQTAEVVRKLAGAGVPLLIEHPGCDSIVAYELDMIGVETQAPLIGYLPEIELLDSQSWQDLVRLTRPGSSDAHPQLSWERTLPTHDRQTVLDQLARDAVLAGRLLGVVQRVVAMADGATSEALPHLSVQMISQTGQTLRWSLAPEVGSKRLKSLVLSTEGHRLLECEWQADESTESISAAILDNLLIGSKDPQRDAPASSTVTALPWLEFARASDVAESAERGFIKGRAQDLYTEAPSEESAFKGVMAASGCLILMLVLAFLFVGSVIEGFRLPNRMDQVVTPDLDLDSADEQGAEEKQEVKRSPLWIRLWPVYPLAIFLALQFLKAFARSNRPGTGFGPPNSENGSEKNAD